MKEGCKYRKGEGIRKKERKRVELYGERKKDWEQRGEGKIQLSRRYGRWKRVQNKFRMGRVL